MGKPSLKVDTGLIRKLYTWFIPRPANMFARVYRTEEDGSQSIGSAAWTAVSFPSGERWDTGANSDVAPGFHDTTGNQTRLTATVSGNYIITGHIAWAHGAGTVRAAAIRHTRPAGAATYIAMDSKAPLNMQANLYTAHSIATEFWMRKRDYVELMVYQDSGGNLNVLGGLGYSAEFTITRVP